MAVSRTKFVKGPLVLLIALCLLPGLRTTAGAQENFPTGGKIRIQPYLAAGAGSSKVDLGTTSNGDAVTISGGGGAAGGIMFGYGLNSWLDIDLSAGYQKSVLTPAVSNAEGSFTRTFYLVTLKYRFPVSERFQIKVGAGGGLYKPRDMDIDAAGVTNGFHDIIEYKDAIGAHVMTEFEIFVMRDLAVNIGLKYYSVTFRESSATRNGAPVFFTDSKVQNLDGSGFDLLLSVAKYF
jgi:outer membrane protein with beta-barrel domain